MNKHARALGRLSRGVSKHYSAEEIRVRTRRLAEARKRRWVTGIGNHENQGQRNIYRKGS